MAHAMLGEIDMAKAALSRVREIQLFSDPETRARYVGAFRLAGLT